MRNRLLSHWCALALALLIGRTALGQELTYLPLQRPGQASVAVDRARRVAFVFDLGMDQDGKDIQFEGKPLLDRLEELEIDHIVFTCSHPHRDHMGGIRALFRDRRSFLRDGNVDTPRFAAVTVVEDGMLVKNSLYTMLTATLPAGTKVTTKRIDGRSGNAFAGLTSADAAVQVESIPYTAVDAAGVHGRSIVVKITLNGGETIVDFDDADNRVVAQVAKTLRMSEAHVDTFVVPHHGSRAGDLEPILALKPRRAVIAVNPENRYGHPGGQLLQELIEKLGAENVYFTGSTNGTVFGRDGVISVAHTAAQRDSYALFVQEAHSRAKARDDKVEVAAYDDVRLKMLGRPGEPPPDLTAGRAGPPPKGPQGPGSAAIAERIRAQGTMHSPEFDAMHVGLRGTTSETVASHRVFGRGDATQTSTITDATRATTPSNRGITASRARQQMTDRARQNFSVSGRDAATPLAVATPETLAGVPSAVEVSVMMTAPTTTAPLKGGMVFLKGGTLYVSASASELFGGTLDQCGTNVCVKPADAAAAPYVLPFAAGRLFGEVWDRVAVRHVESFYLSINPTKRFLQSTEFSDLPSDRLVWGTGSSRDHANEVVTAGDIERSEIGKILWEADVTFKSESLGFNVLTGQKPLTRPTQSLIRLAVADQEDWELDARERWCRLYWTSGAQSVAVNATTRRVSFRGDAVLARSEPMVLENGELRDHSNGTWCSEPKQVAATLQHDANTGSTRWPILNRLRELAEMQTFVKWARDNGVTLTPRLASLVADARTDLASFTVPSWTSGIRSNPQVLVQQQNGGTARAPERVLHVSFEQRKVLDDCVMPAWNLRNTEFPAAGLVKDSKGVWTNQPPGFLTAWMTRFTTSVAQCSNGRVLPPAVYTGLDPLKDEADRVQVLRVDPHVQATEAHGGILLGARRDFLRAAWHDDGLLRTPDGIMVFKRVDDDLHFWNYADSVGSLSRVGQHVVVHGGTIVDAAIDEGNLRFVVSAKPASVVREEFRVERAGAFTEGFEWAGARHGSDGGVILEKAAWRCSAEDVSCVGMADIPFGQVGALLDVDEDTEPLVTVQHLDDNMWTVSLDLSRVDDWYNDQLEQAEDVSSRLMVASGRAQWGFEESAFLDLLLLREEFSEDSVDTVLPALLQRLPMTREDLESATNVFKAQKDVAVKLEAGPVTQSVAALRRIEHVIEPLPPFLSSDLYERQLVLCEALLGRDDLAQAVQTELDAMAARLSTAAAIRTFLVEGASSPWRESGRR